MSSPDPDFAPPPKMTKEQHARAIRADRGADDPERSLLDALDDYVVLCGGEPLEDGWRVDMKMRLNGASEGTYDVYYFNPEGVRFRSRAEAVRHLGLRPIAAPKHASKSQPARGGKGGDRDRVPAFAPTPPETPETIPDVMSRADAAASAATRKETRCPFAAAEGVVVVDLGVVDARRGYHDATHVYPVGYKTEWNNADGSATFISEVVDPDAEEGGGTAGGGTAGGGKKKPRDAPKFRVTRVVKPPSSKPSTADAGEPTPAPPLSTPPPLVVEASTPLKAWAKMVIASNAGETRRSAGTADRFCLDDVVVLRQLERDANTAARCPGYQYVEQRGGWAEEESRRERVKLHVNRELLRALKHAAEAQARSFFDASSRRFSPTHRSSVSSIDIRSRPLSTDR
mgnify:CR=1 FL=1|jgi:hypothetical protein